MQAPDTDAEGVVELVEKLKAVTYKPTRSSTGPFIYSVDHCFSIKGQGTVMTGTVLSGAVQINDVSSCYIYLFCFLKGIFEFRSQVLTWKIDVCLSICFLEYYNFTILEC